MKNNDNNKELLDTIIMLYNDGYNISKIARETNTARSTVSSLIRMYNHLNKKEKIEKNGVELKELQELDKLKQENNTLKEELNKLKEKINQEKTISKNLDILQNTFFDNEKNIQDLEKNSLILKELKEENQKLQSEIKLLKQNENELKYHIAHLKSKVYDDFWLNIYNFRYFYLSLFIIVGIILQKHFSIYEKVINFDYSKILNLF